MLCLSAANHSPLSRSVCLAVLFVSCPFGMHRQVCWFVSTAVVVVGALPPNCRTQEVGLFETTVLHANMMFLPL